MTVTPVDHSHAPAKIEIKSDDTRDVDMDIEDAPPPPPPINPDDYYKPELAEFPPWYELNIDNV